MTSELDWQLGLAPAVRMALHGYQAEFGGLPGSVWRVPGTVTLLASGPLRLTVAAPWSAVAAAGRTEDGVIELVLMERPGEHERVPAAAAAAGHGPAWAGAGLALAGGLASGGGPAGGRARPAGYAGTRLLVRSELPDGAGVGMSAAIETAIRLSLGNPAARGPEAEHVPGRAVLGGRAVPCDLASAGLRLVLVDTRVRRAARPAPAEE
jgi:galactokinase